MSDYSALKATIDANITDNGQGDITGPVLNAVLNEMVDVLGNSLEMGLCVEDGLYFVDSMLNVGAKIDSNGVSAINLITMEEI